MKATDAKFLDFLNKSVQFVVPIYQRTYSWTEKECEQLLDDIVRAGKSETSHPHFVGSIVYIEGGEATITSQSKLLVIDGQQRMTSITLLIEALARALGDEELVAGFSAKKLRNYYLLNDLESGEQKYKLLLSQNDKESLISYLDNKALPADYSTAIKENFDFFVNQLSNKKDDLYAVCNGLTKLMIVDIRLKVGDDDPQLIFESLNSTGKKLSQADLIRNYVLMGLEPDFQSDLYTRYWRPMELDFGQKGYAEDFDDFVRDFLTLKSGEIPRQSDVYASFKEYSEKYTPENIEKLVNELREYSVYYCAIAWGKESDVELKKAFSDFATLKADVAHPLLLEFYADYVEKLLTKDEMVMLVNLVGSYVFRRAVCDVKTNSMNLTFARFTKNIDKSKYIESVIANFQLLATYKRFPDDQEFRQCLKTRDIYHFGKKTYLLGHLENVDRKEQVSVLEYTIEHIMPQNEKVSKEWIDELGDEWERIHETYLHTLGNLTLTGYNSEYSDNSFTRKKEMTGGFNESPLRLNQTIAKCEIWNEKAILERANNLTSIAINIWKRPVLAEDVLEPYKPVKKISNTYTFEDHKYLTNSKTTRTLFDELESQIMNLDTNVYRVINSLYVAFKADTNFVDVVPKAKSLRLSINLKFSEVYDPENLCRDVTGLGRWGNGSVSMDVNSLSDIPYAMTIIQQGLFAQLD